MNKDDRFLMLVLMLGLTVLVVFVGFSCAARFGVGTDFYCSHFSTQADTFCIVRELRK